MLKTIREYLNGFLDLFYPDLCIACHENEKEVHDAFCFDCYSKLPFTNFDDFKDNEFTAHFKGKLEIETGNALFFFVKQGIVQELIQELKYKNMSHYGIKLGEIMGETSFGNNLKENIDLIVPVPLHKKKESKRGYNQSEMFAKGLSKSTGRPISVKNLIRTKNTSTQTKMNREQRINNLKNAFKIYTPEEFRGKHILLVDDVLTTGSTLLECASVIKNIPDVKISFATIAMGEPV